MKRNPSTEVMLFLFRNSFVKFVNFSIPTGTYESLLLPFNLIKFILNHRIYKVFLKAQKLKSTVIISFWFKFNEFNLLILELFLKNFTFVNLFSINLNIVNWLKSLPSNASYNSSVDSLFELNFECYQSNVRQATLVRKC